PIGRPDQARDIRGPQARRHRAPRKATVEEVPSVPLGAATVPRGACDSRPAGQSGLQIRSPPAAGTSPEWPRIRSQSSTVMSRPPAVNDRKRSPALCGSYLDEPDEEPPDENRWPFWGPFFVSVKISGPSSRISTVCSNCAE